MASIKDISSPVKAYNYAKDVHMQNIEEYFSLLLKNSNTNLEENKQICDSYYKKLQEIETANKQNNKIKRKKGLFKFLMVICFICIILIPLGIYLKNKIKNQINNSIKEVDEKITKLTNEANEKKNEAIKQTALLNSMYDWNVSSCLFSKTIPLVELDQYFNNERFYYLHDKYGYKEHDGETDISTVYVQSGTIYGNPFVIEKNYVQEMSPHTYTGTLLITWVTYEHTDNGTRTVHHSQTLVAHVIKPVPVYYLDTWLVYGNEAAPKLSFSRNPSNANSLNDKQLEKLGKKFDKKLDKISQKDMSFTKMANSKFEGLFKALDRDNEVEFRLLFTPLAQENMIDLITCKQPYGDDFYFIKKNCLNYIKTNHSQDFDYSSSPSKFINFDLTKGKESFVNYNLDYFNHLYFDLAPLLSIPLYQNYKAKEYIYKDNHQADIISFEVESLANAYNSNYFRPKGGDTDLILKSKFIRKTSIGNEYEISSYSFKRIPHVELVPTLGGDGRMHPVPVTWYEYAQVKCVVPFIAKISKLSQEEFNKNSENIFANNNIKDIYYQKGLISGLLYK